MRELYNSPMAEVIEFEIKDVITTSSPLDSVGDGAAANEDSTQMWIDKFD